MKQINLFNHWKKLASRGASEEKSMGFDDLFKELKDLEHISKTLTGQPSSDTMTIHKLKNKTVVLINVAGLRKEDIRMSVVGKYTITVNAERKLDFDFMPDKIIRKESFQLPDENLDFELIEATVVSGLLIITIPVKTSDSKIRTIQLK